MDLTTASANVAASPALLPARASRARLLPAALFARRQVLG